jgi:hypothetical protein
MKFGPDGRPSAPDFWDNGQPKWNIRLVLAGPSGGFRTWIITPAGKAAKEGKKPSVHLDLFALAGGVNMMNLLEKTIEIETDAPPSGFSYGVGNPRPWRVKLSTEGPFQLAEPLDPIYQIPQLLANTAVSGGVMQNQGMATSSQFPVSADTNSEAAPEPAPAPVSAPVDDGDAPPF